MKCLNCGNKEFEKRNIRHELSIRDEPVEVITPAFVCKKCEEPLMDGEQMNQLRKAAADEYRQRNNLLTSRQIADYRAGLGMSQVEFAKYLNVGEASIKRWETYYIQDPVQNDHILLKCDSNSARQNALSVYWENHTPDIYSGHRQFSVELFEQVILCLLPYAKSPLYLNKALFYVDFLHFKHYKRSITGARYATLEYGPCPDQYQVLFESMLRRGLIEKGKGHDLKRKKEPDLGFFDHQEQETINTVIALIKKRGERFLFDVSHKEKGFVVTPSFSFISYEYADDLGIQKKESI